MNFAAKNWFPEDIGLANLKFAYKLRGNMENSLKITTTTKILGKTVKFVGFYL